MPASDGLALLNCEHFSNKISGAGGNFACGTGTTVVEQPVDAKHSNNATDRNFIYCLPKSDYLILLSQLLHYGSQLHHAAMGTAFRTRQEQVGQYIQYFHVL